MGFLESCMCFEKKTVSRACMEGDLDFLRKNITDREGAISKDSNSETPIFEAIRSTKVPVVRYLLGVMGIPYAFVDEEGWGLLHEAVSSGSIEMVKYILRTCPTTTYTKTRDGVSPLHIAVFGESCEILDLLLKKTPSTRVSPRGAGGRTPIMLASSLGRRDMMKSLFFAGASFFELDDKGDNSIEMAKESKVLDTIYELHVCVCNGVSGLPMSRSIAIGSPRNRRNERKRMFFGIE